MTVAPTPELTTVGPDLAVVHEGAAVRRYKELVPDTDYDLGGFHFRTLPEPGELLSRFATVNDVHFGETECGVVDGLDIGPILRAPPGAEPYPEMMNRCAVDEIAAIDPAAVVVKGDLTSRGEAQEYRAFLDRYETAFGERLVHVRGNHDSYHGGTFAAFPTQELVLPGVRLAVLDTSRAGLASGVLDADQLDWLDTVAAESDRPVLVFGHHHPWSPTSGVRPSGYFGIDPSDSEALVEVVARRSSIIGYFAGHTHRNRLRRFEATGQMPWVEVSSVKDFPGAWAEYRVHEHGIVQVFHRISAPEALTWTDETRQMFNGSYGRYAFGELADRCFVMSPRPGSR